MTTGSETGMTTGSETSGGATEASRGTDWWAVTSMSKSWKLRLGELEFLKGSQNCFHSRGPCVCTTCAPHHPSFGASDSLGAPSIKRLNSPGPPQHGTWTPLDPLMSHPPPSRPPQSGADARANEPNEPNELTTEFNFSHIGGMLRPMRYICR
eukprot:371731-Prorocentrum_minimum.AAC.1